MCPSKARRHFAFCCAAQVAHRLRGKVLLTLGRKGEAGSRVAVRIDHCPATAGAFVGAARSLVSTGLRSVGSLRLPNGSSQWILGAFVQSTYSIAVESLLVDFKIRAQEIRGRKLLDCKANRFRGPAKSLIAHWPLCVAVPCREQFRRGRIIKGIHVF